MFYLVCTPIGNIEDTSLRQVKTLTEADIILAEDSRTFNTFYQRIRALFNLEVEKKQRLFSFHKLNEFEKIPLILKFLRQGKKVALVTESGTPIIQDPGSQLLKEVVKEKIAYTVIPGPSAFVSAYVLSSFAPARIFFFGFLPKKKTLVHRCIDTIIKISHISPETVFIFYQSPSRINRTLALMARLIPNADVCLCREMTKKFEEVIRGKAEDLRKKTYKGEITVVLKL